MSSKATRRPILNTEEESEDLFLSPSKKIKKKGLSQKKEEDDVIKDDSLFGELISKAGYILKKGDQSNLLKCDQAVFQKALRYSLRTHSHYSMPEIAEKFVQGLEGHVEDEVRLKWALLYTQTVPDCVSARGGQQDSLIRLCLNIDELQPCLIKLLTEKLLEIAYDDENSNRVDIPCLILANLKWLDRVVDSDTLTAKIVDLLEGSPVKVQQEVINFVPSIVDDANHPKIAEVLCNLYDTTPELTPAILDALGHLTLAPESLEDVRHSVLKTLQAARAEQLPVVVKFLLHNTPQSMAYQVVSDMREKINLPGDCAGQSKSPSKAKRKGSSSEDDAAYETLLFSNIKMAALIYKFLTNAWLKAIQDVDDVNSLCSFDILLLLVLYDAAPSRRRPIESIFRNKIRMGLISDHIIEKTVTNHRAVFKEYFQSAKKMASLLLRSPEPSVSQAGASLYRYCFTHLDGYQKQEIVLTLLKHLGDTASVRIIALSLLCTLAHTQTLEMSKFTIFLKGSLDMVDELNMVEVKKLLDVVSRLAFSDSSHAALQDELAIMVRKQLSHSDIKYKLIGVLNAVQNVKNMVELDESQGSLESTGSRDPESSIIKEAENMLHLVLSSTTKSPAAAALFMDEMASIILKEGMNSKIEDWVCERMTDDFQDTFVLDYGADSQPQADLFPVEGVWNLDEGEERGIIMNLAPMIIKAEATRQDVGGSESRMMSLSPQFRLLRMLESRLHDGDLGNIDALLGCPVYFPEESIFEKFTSLSQSEQHAALSCLFYTINWFRELINAFVTQKDPEIKSKVYNRLQLVIKLQNKLAQCLPACPSYSPPQAIFDLDTSVSFSLQILPNAKKAKKTKKSTATKGKKGKGKKNDEAQLGTQACSQPATQPSTQPTVFPDPDDQESGEKEVSSVADMSVCRPFLRELHLDVFCLLFRKLALDTELDAQGQLTLQEAEFLLKDLNMKLSHVFEAGGKRTSPLGNATDKNIGHSHLDLFTAVEVAHRAHRFLKPVCVHLEAISEFFQSLIADNDGIMDAPAIFSERTRPLVKVYSLLFTTLSAFLSWPGLQQEENMQILISVLRTIGKKLEGEAVSGMEKEELVSVVFRYISNFHTSVVSIDTADVLVQALVALTVLSHDGDLKEKLIEVLQQLLKREWYTVGGEKERGSVYNQHVFTLLQIYLKVSSNPLTLVETLSSEGLEEFLNATGRNPCSEAYPTLNKGTLGVYYRSIFSYLVTGTKKSLPALASTLAANRQEYLTVWCTSIKVFSILVGTIKKYDSRNLLGPCLKYSRLFLELFLRSAMPLLDSCLREHNQEVVTLLKNLQTSTRFLQHVCTHSKVNKDTSLTRYVPPMKKSLEMLVYRVKAMLATNLCSGAFWMGNLKNRDLHGEELLSQSAREEEKEESEQGEGEGEEEEEEEEVEDDQSDVELDEDDEDKSTCKEETNDGSTDYSVSF